MTHTSTIPRLSRSHTIALAALTLCTFGIHGYHPLAEDGGLYVAGIESSLNPALFPHDLAFVGATRHYSLFTPIMASIVRTLHIPLPWLLLVADLAGIWLLLYAAWSIAARCFHSQRARLGAAALVAAWFTLPIAGTSLYLMDPYVTARTFSTPLSLLAIAFALGSRRDLWRSVLCLLAAAAFHPLMAAYAAGFIVMLRVTMLASPRARIAGWTILAASALLLAAALQAATAADSTAAVAAAFSRPYWFLWQWQWFELLGIIGPLIVLALLMRRGGPIATLCRASIAVGIIATLISLLFAHQNFGVHLVARLQPMREFLPIYAVMIVLLGGVLAEYFSRRIVPALFIAAMACTMFYVQRQTFPASQHLELPHRAPTNPWSEAFLWARDNTPINALFAIDANYITTDGEDGQTFRATAQRSILADFSKDGGEAAIRPALAEDWLSGSTVQHSLSTLDDAQRDARLHPFGVTWMILHTSAHTTHNCPYSNGAVKVCSLDR